MMAPNPNAISTDQKDTRIFLGWESPAIRAVAAFMLRCHTERNSALTREIDFSDTLVILPTSRAKRVLLSTLVELSESHQQQSMWFSPPVLATPTQAIDLLVPPKTLSTSPASSIEQRLVWEQAVRQLSLQTYEHLVMHGRRTDKDIQSVARILRTMLEELTLAGHTIESSLQVVHDIIPETMQKRWHAAATTEGTYFDLLASHGLHDPGVSGQSSDTDRSGFQQVYLACTTELPYRLKELLQQCVDTRMPLIYAPADMHTMYDDLGCCITRKWNEWPIPLTTEHVVRAGDVRSQCQAALTLALGNTKTESHDVTFGLLDLALGMPLVREAELLAKESVRPPTHATLLTTDVGRFLVTLDRFLALSTPDTLTLLLRQRLTRRILQRLLSDTGYADNATPDTVLAHLDAMRSSCMPSSFDALKTQLDRLPVPDSTVIHTFLKQLRALTDFTSADRDTIAGIINCLQELLGFGSSEPALEVCRGVLHQFASLRIGTRDQVAPQSIVKALIEQLDKEMPAPLPTSEEIEAVGLLELVTDPAEHVVILGANENTLPMSPQSHPWLTDTVRKKLHLPTWDDRAARDACILTTLLRSKKTCRIITGTTDQNGDQVLPSPLLFHTEDVAAIELAQHTLHTTYEASKIVPALIPGERDLFSEKKPAEPVRIDILPVTSFRTYIASPYQFYLQHIAHAFPIECPSHQLGPIDFGILLHRVLHLFGLSDAKHSKDPNVIASVLSSTLDACTQEFYGDTPNTALLLQRRAAYGRLHRFAEWQAAHASQGWRIKETEWSSDPAILERGTTSVQLRGQIDRIDINAQTGELAVIDYKTSESLIKPDQAHKTSEGWTNLQLPLYRHLLGSEDKQRQIKFMYVALPKKPANIGGYEATWDENELLEADMIALALVNRMRRGIFDDNDALEAASLNALTEDLPNSAGATHE
ncbi:MAG: PD-(D/E)XK nuclease family protein [Phycisphaeraceae bacterium]|nr:PD-(D/E)XK nuclease family protein [Phycisphaerales bacterium]MCB9861658.1 PD-(D/E)XK nuclease family protein [Phycisphaeraceae bacterium]